MTRVRALYVEALNGRQRAHDLTLLHRNSSYAIQYNDACMKHSLQTGCVYNLQFRGETPSAIHNNSSKKNARAPL